MTDSNLVNTPKKKNHESELRMINSPAQSEKDLYELLIGSEHRIQMPCFYSVSSEIEEESYSSEMISEEEYSSEQQTPNKPFNKTGNNFIYYANAVTPIKSGKGCHCYKSHCLKKYCYCFKMGSVCSAECSCIGCYNEQITSHHTYILKDLEKTRSGKGGKYPKCNCQKSHCLKDYCYCHSAGRRCAPSCNCIYCENKETSFNHSSRKKQYREVSMWNYPRNSENVLFN